MSLPMDDAARVAELRSQYPALSHHIYLNTGTSGPLARDTAEAIAAETMREAVAGRMTLERFGVLGRARSSIAAALEVSRDEVALTTSTGDGLNIVLLGLPWQAGDEVITTTTEHSSLLLPLGVLRQRYGVVVRFADLPADDAGVIAALEARINTRTRLLALSHVSYATGAVAPLLAVAKMAHGRGIAVLMDGAQAFCSIPLDLTASGVDFYAVTGQKWLCGPEGTGALYVRRAALDRLTPTVAGLFMAKDSTPEGYFLPHHGARRLEGGTRYLPAVAGQINALERWRDVIGPDWAYARIQRLAARLMAGLGGIPRVEVITPPHAHAGLVSIRADGLSPESLASQLDRDHAIWCRSIPWTPWLRFSTGWYNTEEEVDRTVAAVEDAVRRTG